MSGGKARGGGESWHGRGAAPGLFPSCPTCSSKLRATLGRSGIQHCYPSRVQNQIALGIQHRDAPEPCAPSLPPSKLLLTHCTSTPLPQAPAAPLHLQRAKQGQRPVPAMGGLQEPPAAARAGQGGIRRMPGRDQECCAGRSCLGDGASNVCSAPRAHRWGREAPAGR